MLPVLYDLSPVDMQDAVDAASGTFWIPHFRFGYRISVFVQCVSKTGLQATNGIKSVWEEGKLGTP